MDFPKDGRPHERIRVRATLALVLGAAALLGFSSRYARAAYPDETPTAAAQNTLQGAPTGASTNAQSQNATGASSSRGAATRNQATAAAKNAALDAGASADQANQAANNAATSLIQDAATAGFSRAIDQGATLSAATQAAAQNARDFGATPDQAGQAANNAASDAVQNASNAGFDRAFNSGANLTTATQAAAQNARDFGATPDQANQAANDTASAAVQNAANAGFDRAFNSGANLTAATQAAAQNARDLGATPDQANQAANNTATAAIQGAANAGFDRALNSGANLTAATQAAAQNARDFGATPDQANQAANNAAAAAIQNAANAGFNRAIDHGATLSAATQAAAQNARDFGATPNQANQAANNAASAAIQNAANIAYDRAFSAGLYAPSSNPSNGAGTNQPAPATPASPAAPISSACPAGSICTPAPGAGAGAASRTYTIYYEGPIKECATGVIGAGCTVSVPHNQPTQSSGCATGTVGPGCTTNTPQVCIGPNCPTGSCTGPGCSTSTSQVCTGPNCPSGTCSGAGCPSNTPQVCTGPNCSTGSCTGANCNASGAAASLPVAAGLVVCSMSASAALNPPGANGKIGNVQFDCAADSMKAVAPVTVQLSQAVANPGVMVVGRAGTPEALLVPGTITGRNLIIFDPFKGRRIGGPAQSPTKPQKGTQQQYLTFTFQDIQITSVQPSSPGQNAPTESVQLNFGGVNYQFSPSTVSTAGTSSQPGTTNANVGLRPEDEKNIQKLFADVPQTAPQLGTAPNSSAGGAGSGTGSGAPFGQTGTARIGPTNSGGVGANATGQVALNCPLCPDEIAKYQQAQARVNQAEDNYRGVYGRLNRANSQGPGSAEYLAAEEAESKALAELAAAKAARDAALQAYAACAAQKCGPATFQAVTNGPTGTGVGAHSAPFDLNCPLCPDEKAKYEQAQARVNQAEDNYRGVYERLNRANSQGPGSAEYLAAEEAESLALAELAAAKAARDAALQAYQACAAQKCGPGKSLAGTSVRPPSMTCTANVAGSLLLRTESEKELLNDFVFTCTGAPRTPQYPGSQVPVLGNFQIHFGSSPTPSGANPNQGGMLVINDPGKLTTIDPSGQPVTIPGVSTGNIINLNNVPIFPGPNGTSIFNIGGLKFTPPTTGTGAPAPINIDLSGIAGDQPITFTNPSLPVFTPGNPSGNPYGGGQTYNPYTASTPSSQARPPIPHCQDCGTEESQYREALAKAEQFEANLAYMKTQAGVTPEQLAGQQSIVQAAEADAGAKYEALNACVEECNKRPRTPPPPEVQYRPYCPYCPSEWNAYQAAQALVDKYQRAYDDDVRFQLGPGTTGLEYSRLQGAKASRDAAQAAYEDCAYKKCRQGTGMTPAPPPTNTIPGGTPTGGGSGDVTFAHCAPLPYPLASVCPECAKEKADYDRARARAEQHYKKCTGLEQVAESLARVLNSDPSGTVAERFSQAREELRQANDAYINATDALLIAAEELARCEANKCRPPSSGDGSYAVTSTAIPVEGPTSSIPGGGISVGPDGTLSVTIANMIGNSLFGGTPVSEAEQHITISFSITISSGAAPATAPSGPPPEEAGAAWLNFDATPGFRTTAQPRGRFRPAAWHSTGSPFASSFFSLVTVDEREPGVESPGGIVYAIVANGKSSGEALELQLFDPSGRTRQVELPEGTILEPLKRGTPNPVAAQAPAGARLLTKQLTAYCVDHAKLPPQPGQIYRIAPPAVQAKYPGVSQVLRAGRELAARGALHPDSDPQEYANSIQQYSVWSKLESWGQQKFTEQFLEHTKKNAQAMNVKWTQQMEQAVRSIAPGRWQDISQVLEQAKQYSQAPGRPGAQ